MFKLTSILLLPASPVDGKALLTIAASIETFSPHPIGKAIVDAARKNHCKMRRVEHFRAFPGLGVAGLLDGLAVIMGSANFLGESRVQIDDRLLRGAGEWQDGGDLAVFCAWEGCARGVLRFSPIREGSSAADD
ncbi:MAG: HAD family hydrolase [Elusimicrobia bacterium]|nr:HAD family hydrolase [Elusimicrobiota bacterium]